MATNSHLLVLGGARSGKSRYAEQRAASWPGEKLYLASAEAKDQEMRQRIAAHQSRRGADWQTLEEPLDIAAAIRREAAADKLILFDCVTLWLSNLLLAERDVQQEVDDLAAAVAAAPGQVIVVSNEVGLGIVPGDALSRRFRDEAGIANQKIAATVGEAVLVAAGLPLALKSP